MLTTYSMLCVHKDPKIGGVRETMLATVRGHDRAVSRGDHPSDRPMILLLELVVQMHNMSSGNHRAAKLARLQDPSPRRPPRRHCALDDCIRNQASGLVCKSGKKSYDDLTSERVRDLWWSLSGSACAVRVH